MRISDWSSDVCSSDLLRYTPRHGRHRDAAILALAPPPAKAGGGWEGVVTVRTDPKAPLPNPPLPSQGRELCRSDADLFPQTAPLVAFLARRGAGAVERQARGAEDRKSVVEGKSGSVSLDLGGLRTI